MQELVNEIIDDFNERRKLKRDYELSWLVNMNFLSGNQYCTITPQKSIELTHKQFSWESREVFNHIAPIIETRLSKLSRVKPSMSVRAASGDDADLQTAKLSTKILCGVMGELDFTSLVASANKWCEICGTVFYKVMWDNMRGEKLAKYRDKALMSGDVTMSVVSPFEIYPDNLAEERLGRQKSLIHAKAVSVGEIEELWGVSLAGKSVNVHTLDGGKNGLKGQGGEVMKNAEIVIERYTLPTKKHTGGKLEIVAGNQLLYSGELPYFNDDRGKKTYPFIKQISLAETGCFFGKSMIERLIPIQRAYNSVKNRKFEYLSKISTGILRVEDGSVDTEMLLEDGLNAGSVLVYRQGSTPPTVMENFSLPIDFFREEDRLLNEFILISGVSELTRNTEYGNTASGLALQILSDIEDTKMLVTVDSLKAAIRESAKHILRLYKQYAKCSKLVKVAGEQGKVEVLSFSGSEIAGDDVVFDTESDFTQSKAERRAMTMELVGSGLLSDENGKMNSRMRAKVLDILGFGSLEQSQDIAASHLAKAQFENVEAKNISLLDIDDHEIHILEHTKCIITKQMAGVDEKKLQPLIRHAAEHKMKQIKNLIGEK